MEQNFVQDKVQNLPGKPGVYQFIDQNKEIIYIGKAKNLKKRVSSYFNKQVYENRKIKILVNKIFDIEHIVVESESDALLLENNLIKKFKPRYNINLKDDKSFPWICIKNEPFPRVFATRKINNDGSKYYGPYTSASAVRALLSMIKKLYPLRTCNLNLSPKNLAKRKYKVCLEYHLGNCKGPCELLQTEEDYNYEISQIQDILKGNIKGLLAYFEQMMKDYSDNLQFEKAHEIKEKMNLLENFQMKSTIVNNKISNVDVFTLIEEEKNAWVNFIKVINGSIVQTYSVELDKKLEESKEVILEYALTEIRTRFKSDAKEIILPFIIENVPQNVKITVPVRGDRKKLLDLSLRNAKSYMLSRKQQKEAVIKRNSTERILLTLKKDLRLNSLPNHIECIDNSNIQGTSAVAACVVFKNAKPSKNDYRLFNIKTVNGPNDTASMQEIVQRRYSGLQEKNESLPQLLIVDGGKGQLNAALKSLEKLNLEDKIAVIGIAERLEEIFFPNDPVSLYLNKNSESLKLIQQLRNEAHRFGLQFHRNKRSKEMLKSELENIKGIGSITIEKLMKSLKTYDEIVKADDEILERIIGKSKTRILKKYFQEN